jgi:hypothetical protein
MGSGGGSMGSVDYPEYMKNFHSAMLDGGGVPPAHSVSLSVAEAVNTAHATSPYASLAAFNPDTDITAMETAVGAVSTLATALAYHADYDAMSNAGRAQIDIIAPQTSVNQAVTDFKNAVAALSHNTDYGAMIDAIVAKIDTTIIPAAYITAKIAAFTADLDTAIDTDTYARFRAGMRDIGSVLTSAFVIGEANIEAEKTRQVAKFLADLNFLVQSERKDLLKDGTQRTVQLLVNKVQQLGTAADVDLRLQASKADQVSRAIAAMASMLQNKLEFTRIVAALTVEQRRIKIVAKNEQEGRDTEIDAADLTWDLNIYQYASNVLAGIAGAVSGPKSDRNKVGTAIGGAMTGAAAGYMVGTSSWFASTTTGAEMGSAAGGYGAAAGAVIGLGVGLIMGNQS